MNTELAHGLKRMTDEQFSAAWKACRGADPRLDMALDIELSRRAYSNANN